MAIVTFNFENRNIKAGEFGASFGHNRPIKEAITSNLFISKTMVVTSTETSMTIEYTGKLAKRTHEDIWRLSSLGIITNLSF